MNEITLRPDGEPVQAPIKLPAVNPAELAERRRLVKEVMHSQMQSEVHFGTKGGGYNNTKPALYKAGAEMLANTFMLGVNPRVEYIGSDGEVAYRVTCELVHLPTSQIVGRGVGECSTLEEKYAWRRATGPGEFDYYPADRRRIKWKYDFERNQEYQEYQVRAEPQDKANTILKMAKKRAFVDAIQTTLGVSDMFEDPNAERTVRPEPRQHKGRRHSPRPSSPPPKPEDPPADMTGTVSEGMLKTLQRAMSGFDIDDVAELTSHFGVPSVQQLPAARINDVLDWIRDRGNAK